MLTCLPCSGIIYKIGGYMQFLYVTIIYLIPTTDGRNTWNNHAKLRKERYST